MANVSKNKIEEIKNQAQIIKIVRLAHFLFYIYAFLCFLFWVLNLFELDWLYVFTNLFIIPYKIVHTFYNGQNSFIDFTLAIIGILSILLGLLFNFSCLTYLKYLDTIKIKEEKRLKEQQKKLMAKRAHKKIAAPQEEQRTSETYGTTQSPKLVFLITPIISKIKNSEDELELTFQEVEVWKQRINKKLIENILYSKPIQKGYYRKNLFLMYQDFNYVEEFVYYIKPTIDSIILEFQKYKIAVSFSYVISALPMVQHLEKELDCMDTILSLGFMNECIVTNRFKINYDNKDIRKYDIEFKGEYNLSKNLSISNRQPLFALINKKVKEKKNGNENNPNGAQ